VIGPDGETQTSLPIPSVLDRSKAVAELLRRFPSPNLREAFYSALEININGLLPKEYRRVNRPMSLVNCPADEEEYAIDALQLAGYLIHGVNPDVIHGNATKLSVIMYLLCDAIKNKKPLIITGLQMYAIFEEYDGLKSIEKQKVINVSEMEEPYTEDDRMNRLVFIKHINTLLDLLEGRDVSKIEIRVPIKPTLLIQSSESWASWFESPREQSLSPTDADGFQGLFFLMTNQK